MSKHSHKESAADFMHLVGSGKVHEAYAKYVGPKFRHHNAYFRGDAQSLEAAMAENAAKNPNKVLEIQRVLEDGNLVAVHSRVKLKPEDRGSALIHIFRFHGDLIEELWDIAQPVPENSPNQYGIF